MRPFKNWTAWFAFWNILCTFLGLRREVFFHFVVNVKLFDCYDVCFILHLECSSSWSYSYSWSFELQLFTTQYVSFNYIAVTVDMDRGKGWFAWFVIRLQYILTRDNFYLSFIFYHHLFLLLLFRPGLPPPPFGYRYIFYSFLSFFTLIKFESECYAWMSCGVWRKSLIQII